MENKELSVLLYATSLPFLIAVIALDIDWWLRVVIASGSIISVLIFWFICSEKTRASSLIPATEASLYYPVEYATRDNYDTLAPQYVTNNRNNQAYLISNEVLCKCVKKKAFESICAFKNSRLLKQSLQNQGFVINDTKKATLADIEIIERRDGTLMSAPNPLSEIDMVKLKERHKAGAFKDLELVFVHHFLSYSRVLQNTNFPTDRRLLVDHKKRIARQPPYGDLWMFQMGLFRHSEHRKRLPCYLGTWCWWHYLLEFFPHTVHFDSQPYELSELLATE